jgi:hypothetical protein
MQLTVGLFLTYVASRVLLFPSFVGTAIPASALYESRRLERALLVSNQLTIEAWVRADGPAPMNGPWILSVAGEHDIRVVSIERLAGARTRLMFRHHDSEDANDTISG